MQDAFENKLRQVHVRCHINLLINLLGYIFTGLGIIALTAVLIQKLIAYNISFPNYHWTAMGGSLIILAFLWWYKKPSRLQAAVLIDEKLHFKERFSSAIMFSTSDDPFAQAAYQEAHEKANNTSIGDHFPIITGKNWRYAALAWVMTFAVYFFLPQQDLLGFLQEKKEKDKIAQQIQTVKANIKQVTVPVIQAVNQLGDTKLNEALKDLGNSPADAKPEDIKKTTIRKLGDLSEQIKKKQDTMQLDSVKTLQDMLKQLKSSTDPTMQKLQQMLARGNFSQALDQLKQLEKQLENGDLTKEQKDALSKQFKSLSDQLSELANQNSEMEKELEKLGLNKEMAKLTPQQLKEALQKLGLTPEQIEKLLKKAAACKSASNRCGSLAQAMGSCSAGLAGLSGLSGDELSELMGQLSELESLQQQMMQLQAAMSELSNCMGCLGEGMCQGQGQSPWQSGTSNKFSQGSGGPGKGMGYRDSDSEGNTNTTATKVQNQTSQGPVIASWYFKDSQIKGEAKRDFSAIIQAGKETATEAINDNQIPQKYEQAVKSYFGNLEQN